MSPDLPDGTKDELYAIAVAELAEPLRAAGMGEPSQPQPRDFYLMWHVDGASAHRPLPNSPVWRHGGCYDVTLRHDRQPGPGALGWGEPPEPSERLLLFTEGSCLLDVGWTGDPEVFREHLRGVAASLPEVVLADIRRFETENDGYLPGMEAR